MLITTSKGEFHVEFTHHRNSKKETTQRSIRRFHREVPSQTRRKIMGTTECVIATVPGVNPNVNPRKARPARGITGRSQGDKFKTVIGCRNALSRALDAARTLNPIFGSKRVRQEIWDAFLQKAGVTR